MKKKNILLVAVILAVVMPLAIPAFRAFSSPLAVTVTVDGQAVSFQDQTPVIINNRTMVPIRGVFELLGFDVQWDPYNRIARLTSTEHTIIIPADIPYFVVNYEIITPEVPQRLIGNRMMLPLRAVAEAIGGTAYWDPNGRIAIIISPDSDLGGSENLLTPTPWPSFTPFVTLTPMPVPTPTPWPTFTPFVTLDPLPTPTPWPTPEPWPWWSTPVHPPRTLNHYLLLNDWTGGTSVFDINVYKVLDGEIVSVKGHANATVQSVFAVWAEHNNIGSEYFVNGGMFIDFAWGNSRDLSVILSTDFYHHFEGENGVLLAESLAYTIKGMWRPVWGSVRFGLLICDVTETVLPLLPENVHFYSQTIFDEYDYPHHPYR